MLKFNVDDEVMVIRTKKLHKIVSASDGDPASSYVLDNGTAYWEFELKGQDAPKTQ